MKADQKFNAIIEKVETYFTQTAIPKSREIADSIARSEGMLYREFNAAFQFLTGVSFKEYINERRMDLAYEWLVKMDEFGWDDVIEISGFGDANSFSKAFKKYYSMTPKDAFNKKNRDLIKGPLSWAKLSSANDTEPSIINTNKNFIYIFVYINSRYLT